MDKTIYNHIRKGALTQPELAQMAKFSPFPLLSQSLTLLFVSYSQCHSLSLVIKLEPEPTMNHIRVRCFGKLSERDQIPTILYLF